MPDSSSRSVALSAQTSPLAARRRLARLLGLPDGIELALVDIYTEPPALPWTEDEASHAPGAIGPPPGSPRLTATPPSSDGSGARKLLPYFPTVSLVGVYSHTLNVGSFGSTSDSA